MTNEKSRIKKELDILKARYQETGEYVWAVKHGLWHVPSEHIVGIFSTKEKAEKYLGGNSFGKYMYKVEVDPLKGYFSQETLVKKPYNSI